MACLAKSETARVRTCIAMQFVCPWCLGARVESRCFSLSGSTRVTPRNARSVQVMITTTTTTTAHRRDFDGYSTRVELGPLSNRDSYVEEHHPTAACSDPTKFIALGEEQVSRPKCGKVRIPASRMFQSYGARSFLRSTLPGIVWNSHRRCMIDLHLGDQAFTLALYL